MIFHVFNKRDATIYERSINMNTGLDAMLEISKTIDSAEEIYNSRILLDFDFTGLQRLLNTQTLQSASYDLKLFTTNTNEIPVAYTLYANPVNVSWNMGSGRYGNSPSTTDGASWLYSSGADSGTKWVTASFAAGTTGSYVTNAGGGTWFTAYEATQSFDYANTDLTMDVSNMVRAWLSGSLANNGLIIKKSNTSEGDQNEFKSIKFFSKDTHTIYAPKLQVKWRDVDYQTSHSVVSFNNDVILGVNNLKGFYKETDKVRFNITARPKFPTITFATSSNYLDIYQLPSASCYSLLDAKTNEVIIPFDETYTLISADTNGSYFKLYMDGLQAERYYRIALKAKVSNEEEYVYSNNWIFKVTK